MQDEQVEQPEAAEDETTAGVEGASPDSADTEVAATVDEQAAASTGTTAEAEPEVPSDASDTIARAQEHIDNLNMDEEREAAKRAM
jgi:hypothetical protein